MEELLCPLCKSRVLKNSEAGSGNRLQADLGYGKSLTLGYTCDNEECAFRVCHTAEPEVLFGVTLSYIRSSILTLDVEERAGRLLSYLAIANNYQDEAGIAYRASLMELFHNVLQDTLATGKRILDQISHREPRKDVRRETRRELYFFLGFLEVMEGNYPSAEEEQKFDRLRRALVNADCYYEVGQHFIDTDPALAEGYFAEGAECGGIRSRVAYARHVLAQRESKETMLETYRALAEFSQEACYEYMRYAEVGKDNLAETLRTYARTSYAKRSLSGKLSFIRLQLTVFFNRYLEEMEKLVKETDKKANDNVAEHNDESTDENADETVNKSADELADEERLKEYRYRRILSEMFSLIGQVTEEVDGFEHSLEEYVHNPIAERMMLDEENLVLECAIGCAMYYQIRFDMKLRFDIGYIRECIGHLRCFLSSDLSGEWSYGDEEQKGVEDSRNLKRMRKHADEYVQILQDWCGMEGDAE